MAANTGDSVLWFTYTRRIYASTTSGMTVHLSIKLKGGWDYIVLAGTKSASILSDYDGSSAIQIAYLINLYNPCARILFYMTWGRKNGDASNCAVYPPVCTYEGMDSLIYRSYMQNDCFRLCRSFAGWKSLEIHSPELSGHWIVCYRWKSSKCAGSYAAAPQFYRQLFKKDPVLLSYDFFKQSEALDILYHGIT